ncbi:hypothetical protein PG994_007330 [Apiospora phragmitis]|uniref:Uncharacterized protein n=1 Tax=Apiospora phragmitis TaxID=2905665 RepID=A0ABR1V0J4_9PEZI
MPQHTADGGPPFTLLQATLTVPNLTYASGQSTSGGPYRLGVGCSIFAITDNTDAACNGRGPYMGVNANNGWSSWPQLAPAPMTSDQDNLLNMTAGDELFVQMVLKNSSYAEYTYMNFKNTSNAVYLVQSNVAALPMCSGDGTTAYAGCFLGADDTSNMPGFMKLSFESILVYDRSNNTHDFDLDQQVQFYQLVVNGKSLAMPMLEEAYDFTIQWPENPTFGSSDDGDGGASPPPTLRW